MTGSVLDKTEDRVKRSQVQAGKGAAARQPSPSEVPPRLSPRISTVSVPVGTPTAGSRWVQRTGSCEVPWALLLPGQPGGS